MGDKKAQLAPIVTVIKNASIDQLCQVTGIHKKLASEIYKAWRA